MKEKLKNAKDTKEKLHIYALASYLKEGANNTTFQSLARELKISQAAIYKYYRSKDELLVGTISYAAEKGRLYLIAEDDHSLIALERFKFYIKRNLMFCTDEPLYSVAVITLHYFAVCIPKVKVLHEEINQSRLEKIENYLKLCRHEKSISSKVDLKQAAMQIHSLLMGEMIKAFIWPREKNINIRLENIWDGIKLLMNNLI